MVADDSWADRAIAAASLAGVIGWARGVRTERLYRAGLLQRAEDAERERDLRAEQAVAQERARIARDIHDVVSHSLAVVVVQAAGAERVADRQPERAREALGVIAETARGALTEMRAMLQVLRSGDAAGRDGAPSPGLPDIEALVSELSGRGLPVQLSTTGTPYSLGPGRELALYRVAQESLTNALKHGGRSRADHPGDPRTTPTRWSWRWSTRCPTRTSRPGGCRCQPSRDRDPARRGCGSGWPSTAGPWTRGRGIPTTGSVPAFPATHRRGPPRTSALDPGGSP